jgi:hypothetical protein
LFSHSSDDSGDVVERITPPVSASDGNLTMDSQFIKVSQSSDKLQSQKLSTIGTVRKTK